MLPSLISIFWLFAQLLHQCFLFSLPSAGYEKNRLVTRIQTSSGFWSFTTIRQPLPVLLFLFANWFILSLLFIVILAECVVFSSWLHLGSNWHHEFIVRLSILSYHIQQCLSSTLNLNPLSTCSETKENCLNWNPNL